MKTYLNSVICPLLSLIIDEDPVRCQRWAEPEEIVVITETDCGVWGEVEEKFEYQEWSTNRHLRYVDDDRL